MKAKDLQDKLLSLQVLLSLEKFLSQASSEEKRGISALDASTSAETDGELGSRLPLYSSSKEKLSHLALNRKLMRAVRALDNPDSDGDSEDAKLRSAIILHQNFGRQHFPIAALGIFKFLRSCQHCNPEFLIQEGICGGMSQVHGFVRCIIRPSDMALRCISSSEKA